MHTSMMMAVNSPPVAHRDYNNSAPNSYRAYTNDDYDTIQRADPVQPEENERTKKEKKWSFGKLFRRKKKDDETASSSESDEGVSTRSKRKSRKKKKRPSTTVSNFDHIVVRDSRRAQSLAKNNHVDHVDDGVLSDPSAGFVNYRFRGPLHSGTEAKESYHASDISNRLGPVVLDTNTRKSRKGRLKARVEALRNSMRGDSSSDEESLRSSNSSCILRFRSDDSLMRSRDSSLNKRSRSARNERYIKRLSRDEENQLNKEAELLQQGYTKSEVEMLTRTPTSQSSGYGTCRRDQQNKIKQEHLYANEFHLRPMKSESISSFPSTQSYPSSINFNAKINNDHVNYSMHYPNNAKREILNTNSAKVRSTPEQYARNSNDVICVKFPLGNVTNLSRDEKAPPVPPPRDMHRKVTTPVSMHYENTTPNDTLDRNKYVHGMPNNDFERVMRRSQDRHMGYVANGLRRPISNSEDHIAMQNLEYLRNIQHRNEQPRRPASVSAEPQHYGLYANSPPWRKKVEQPNLIKPEPVQPKQDYLYYADQSPRSRRPISIKSSQNNLDNQYTSDSQSTLNLSENIQYRKPRNASEFWKKMDDAERVKRQQNNFANSRSSSDNINNIVNRHSQSFDRMSQNDLSDVRNKNLSKANSLSRDITDSAKMWKATTEYKRALTVEPESKVTSPTRSHTRNKSDTITYQMPSDNEKTPERRKSTNLDDALNELEAIYNSLGLGDEDLLDRAERRELMTPKFNDWNGNDEELQLRGQPVTPLRRVVPRRATLPDKLQDDMAFRRLNSKERQTQPSKDSQSQISYMLASPVYIPYASDDDRHPDRKEPDIVYDDVMYRNIKQANNRLKTMDPQPPFGIPVGPVSPAPQSDYLHAQPENKGRSRFVPRRSPDLVSDDLAYRSLRKDNTRHSKLFNGDEFKGYTNNNQIYNEYPPSDSPASLKKKRAVRSLSANIFTMIQKEIDDALNMSKLATIQKTKSNSDVARRMREACESSENEPEHYPRNKVKQRHNTVNLYVNNIHAPSNHFAKDDSFIHNDEKFLPMPPSCDKSKSSSPSNRSPQVTKRASKDEFQQVLTKLAQEAMDTSNKLGVALAELDKNRNNVDKRSDIQTRISDSRQLFLNGLTERSDFDRYEPEIKHVRSHSDTAAMIEKVPIARKISLENKAKNTEDSLMVISDSLHKVEDQLKNCIEKEIKSEDNAKNVRNYTSNADEKTPAQETSTVTASETKIFPNETPVTVRNVSEPVKIVDAIVKQDVVTVNNTTNNQCEEKCNELNEIKAFKDLKDGISDLIAGISQVNEKLSLPKPQVNTANNEKIASITEVSDKLDKVAEMASKQPSTKRQSVNLSIYEDDLELRKETTDSTEYNSSEELASIFKNDQKLEKNAAVPPEPKPEESNVRADLCSPKLVQTVNQNLRRLSVDKTDESKPSQSQSLPTNIVPWRTKRQNLNSQRDDRGE